MLASCSFSFPRISTALFFWEQSLSKIWPSWRKQLSFHQKCLACKVWVLNRKVASLSSEDGRAEWSCPVLLPCIDALTLHPGPFAPHCPESSSFLQFLGFDPCVAFYPFRFGDFIPDWISVYSSLPHQITHLVSVSSMGPNVTSSLRLPCKSRF